MSEEAKRDLAMAMLKTVDEAWSVVYDWVRERIDPEEEEEFPERPVEASIEERLAVLQNRVAETNEAWKLHMKHHDHMAYMSGGEGRNICAEIQLLKARTEQVPPKPPTLIEKLEIQKLQKVQEMQEKNMGMHERHLASLLTKVEELERKERERDATSQGSGTGVVRIPIDDNYQSIRVWSQAGGTGCSGEGDRITASDAAADGPAGKDPVSETGGKDAVQSGGGEHVSAADGGAQPGGR